MTHQLDDWEGRLAALAAGVRYRKPRSRALSAVAQASTAEAAQDDQQTFLAEQCPCDKCDLRQKCAAQGLACARYARFSEGKAPESWRSLPIEPTRKRFEALFGQTGELP